ncbi:MAG: hypothetical protein JWO44_2628 [Bacteroidetes bacterium]|nr:hypothetical protein [Bacteroidota bacterium]
MKHIGLLFPGGGTHYVGMGSVLYQESSLAKNIFMEASEVLGYDLSKICFSGELSRLASMEYSQPAIFTVSVAAHAVCIAETGLTPQCAAGHSLGEYSALVSSGSLSFADGIRLIKKRGLLLQEMGKGGKTMMAVNKIESSMVEAACAEIVRNGGQAYVAVYNSTLQHVLSGDKNDLGALGKRLEKMGAFVEMLDIDTPSHSPLMLDAINSFSDELNACKFQMPSYSVVSNVTGKPYTSAAEIPVTLLDHMIRPVQWQQSIKYMCAEGINCFVETGPRSVLKGLMGYINDTVKVYAFDTGNDRQELKNALHVNAPDHRAFLQGCLAIAVSTKNDNVRMDEYKNNVVPSFAALQRLRIAAEEKEVLPAEIKKAHGLLQSILISKCVSAGDAEFLTTGLLNQTGVRID